MVQTIFVRDYSERPLMFYPEEAKVFGVKQAMVISEIRNLGTADMKFLTTRFEGIVSENTIRRYISILIKTCVVEKTKDGSIKLCGDDGE